MMTSAMQKMMTRSIEQAPKRWRHQSDAAVDIKGTGSKDIPVLFIKLSIIKKESTAASL